MPQAHSQVARQSRNRGLVPGSGVVPRPGGTGCEGTRRQTRDEVNQDLLQHVLGRRRGERVTGAVDDHEAEVLPRAPASRRRAYMRAEPLEARLTPAEDKEARDSPRA